MLEPTSGSATVMGFYVQRETEKVKESVEVCPQEPAFFPYLMGKENVELMDNLQDAEGS